MMPPDMARALCDAGYISVGGYIKQQEQKMQINDGDTVLVRMKVRDAASMHTNLVRVVDGKGVHLWVSRTDIVSVESRAPRPLQVGDIVLQKFCTERGEIIAIANDRAWVRSGARKYVTFHLAELQRVSDKPEVKTRRDVLREAYPEQFDRICEVVKEQHREGYFNSPAGDEKAGASLSVVMHFSSTREGHDHWYNLAKAHGY